jgi:hypothetical protein
MSKVAVEYIFTGATTGITTYDSTVVSMGSLMRKVTGTTAQDNFVGPMPIGLARPMEASTAIPGIFPFVTTVDNTTDWIFLADNATAAATRRIVLYEYNKDNSNFNWKGFVTLTFPTGGTHTLRSVRVTRDFHTGGTVSVASGILAGTGTTWVTDKLAVGSRIGFNTTNPNDVSTWYEVSAVTSNTSITLTTPGAGLTITSASTYVAEELRAIVSTTNGTGVVNGGLWVAKGLRYETFAAGGTTIPAATTIDNIRAVYWLADASTVTNTASAGLALDEKVDFSNQAVYVLDTAGRVFTYNIRASLSPLVAGKTTAASGITTGVQAPTGTMSQLNNGRIATLNHGPGNGVKSLYWVTTTRVYRSALSAITSGSITWQSDAMVEIPPGGTSTYAASSTLSSVEVASSLDSLIIMNTGVADARSYVTKYNTVSTPFDRIFLSDDRQLDQSLASSEIVAHPSIQSLPFSCWIENGVGYLARHSAVATTNQVYALPLGADWTYASNTNQRIISPVLSTANAIKYYRAYIGRVENLGSIALGATPEPFRVYYRTLGMIDNTGTWTSLDYDLGLEGVAPGSGIQFMFEFKTIGPYCIPARILNITVVYEDGATDSHYQPSIGLSDKTTKTFAWRFSTAFGTTVPVLRVRLYDAVSNALLVDDNTSSPTGTFEQSTDLGLNWSAWTNTDKTNENTYIRYTPLSLGDNIKVRALLTLN